MISDTRHTILVSAASAWEIATKATLGKLSVPIELTEDFDGQLEQESFRSLSISSSQAIRAGLLPGIHKDPFDRMLIAQAQEQNIPIISNEVLFDAYGIRRVW